MLSHYPMWICILKALFTAVRHIYMVGGGKNSISMSTARNGKPQKTKNHKSGLKWQRFIRWFNFAYRNIIPLPKLYMHAESSLQGLYMVGGAEFISMSIVRNCIPKTAQNHTLGQKWPKFVTELNCASRNTITLPNVNMYSESSLHGRSAHIYGRGG